VIAALPLDSVRLFCGPLRRDSRRSIAAGPQQLVARDLIRRQDSRPAILIVTAKPCYRLLYTTSTSSWTLAPIGILVTEYERDVIPSAGWQVQGPAGTTAKIPAMLFYLDNWQSVGPKCPARVSDRKGVRG